jgi:hypothetical protein
MPTSKIVKVIQLQDLLKKMPTIRQGLPGQGLLTTGFTLHSSIFSKTLVVATVLVAAILLTYELYRYKNSIHLRPGVGIRTVPRNESDEKQDDVSMQLLNDAVHSPDSGSLHILSPTLPPPTLVASSPPPASVPSINGNQYFITDALSHPLSPIDDRETPEAAVPVTEVVPPFPQRRSYTRYAGGDNGSNGIWERGEIILTESSRRHVRVFENRC